MPSDVRITTHRSPKGSGPKNDANAPGVDVACASSTRANASIACMNPPFDFNTDAMTAMIPMIMIHP